MAHYLATSHMQGRIQFLLDALDRAVPKSTSGLNETEALIDRFPIDLELKPGPDFTRKERFSGVYNLMTIYVSFRVECSKNYLGSHCSMDPVMDYSDLSGRNNSKFTTSKFQRSLLFTTNVCGSYIII